MGYWYSKGQSQYTEGNFHMALYMDMNGYDEGNYDSQDIEGDGESGDPFMAFAIDTQTWAYGQAQVEIGLLGSHRIRINSSGVRIWTAGDVWKDPLTEGGGAEGEWFKTITGITNDVVADQVDDTLTLSSANNRLTIVGNSETDTINFNLVEGNINHNALTNYDANRHFLQSEISITESQISNLDHLTEGEISLANLLEKSHVNLTNVTANQHIDNLTDIPTRNHSDLQNKNTEANIKHMTDAQITALHPQLTNLTELGTRNHSDLQNVLTSQHHVKAVSGDISLVDLAEKNHISLTNKNTEANIKHLTDAQVAALHSDVIISVANVEAVITAEIVGGQSIDNAIDALLTANADGYVTQAETDALYSVLAHLHDDRYYTEGEVDGLLHTRLHWMNSGSDHVGNPWNIFYTRADGALIELALGADKTVLTSTGVDSIPAFETGAGHEHLEAHITNLDKYTQAAVNALLHSRSHAMVSAGDHTANTWMLFYSNAGGNIVELALGANNTILASNGVNQIPSFHAKPVAGDYNHNDLANIDAGDIKHLTAAQLGALHTRLHWMNSGSDHVGNPWNIFYTRADGALIELALGVDDTVLTSTGAAAIPAFEPFNAKAVQAVEDAGLVLSAGKIIEYDGTPADGTYTGLVMLIDTTGCATFDAVYVDGINSVAKAQATGIATMPAIGVVVAAGKVLTHGAICSTASWAWAAGAVIYINETVAGELDDTIPALATELVQIMGVATGTDTIHVNPSLDWVVRV